MRSIVLLVAVFAVGLVDSSFAQGREPAGERGGREAGDRGGRERPDVGGRDRPEREPAERGDRPPAPTINHIELRNGCSARIFVALAYESAGIGWRVRGWWSIDPGATIRPGVETMNRNVYFFARDTAGREWNGQQASSSRFIPVVSGQAFDGPFDAVRQNAASRQENFKHWDTGPSLGTYVIPFTCS